MHTKRALLTVRQVAASASIRRMRGQTNAHLVAADDGKAYVTKFEQNPLGHRAVIAEYLGSRLLHHVGLPSPATAIVRCESALKDIPQGVHVGSQYPGDPLVDFVADWLPGKMHDRVQNWRSTMMGIAVFDMWVGNTERRQLVFVRRTREWQAFNIDNTHIFGGLAWSFAPTRECGVMFAHATGPLPSHVRHWSERIKGYSSRTWEHSRQHTS
jgi:hypothetical protein